MNLVGGGMNNFVLEIIEAVGTYIEAVALELGECLGDREPASTKVTFYRLQVGAVPFVH